MNSSINSVELSLIFVWFSDRSVDHTRIFKPIERFVFRRQLQIFAHRHSYRSVYENCKSLNLDAVSGRFIWHVLQKRAFTPKCLQFFVYRQILARRIGIFAILNEFVDHASNSGQFVNFTPLCTIFFIVKSQTCHQEFEPPLGHRYTEYLETCTVSFPKIFCQTMVIPEYSCQIQQTN
jgi:hypothetical protein